MKFFHVVLLLFCILSITNATLSPNSGQKKKEKEKPVKEKKAPETPAVNETFVKDDATKQELLNSKPGLKNDERLFTEGISLAYVTPWNNHGYDVAKFASKKFTHVSPVWFQINQGNEGDAACTIEGQHDMDHGWIEEIRTNNPEIQIVPRFLFDKWDSELESFITNEEHAFRCGQSIVEFLQRNEFNGAVIEIWLQLMVRTRGQAKPYLLEIVQSWHKLFQKTGLTFILPLTCPLGAKLDEIGIIDQQTLTELMENVDYLSLMTYDYPSETPGGVGPLHWIEQNLNYVLQATQGEHASKVLIGINFYGYIYKPTANPALSHEFVKLLKNPQMSLEWDTNAKEHVIREGSNIRAYLPTKRSIEERLKLAKHHGMGIFIWEIGQGLDDFITVL
uniref:GH18 domain-containing protein n=1 Tax=Panagrolaimus sp. PS1159 TaxID=55785 RepID=A0AC35F6P4_9BILA